MKKSLESLLKEFRCPGSFYRGAPFWAWNGKLEPEELQRQIRIMHRMGLGGFFMHSRVGLDTVYLSEDWFRCVRACVEEAEKLKMYAWLYDEDRWPSGAAGGLVTRDRRFRIRSLVMSVTRDPRELRWRREILAAFVASVEGSSVSGIRRIPPGKKVNQLEDGESLLIFSVRVVEPSPWFNGYTYLDTLNPEAVQEFIRVTYIAYQKRFRRFFGKIIPGIFTDEPNYGTMMAEIFVGKENCLSVPWTDQLPKLFRKRYGYDLIEYLPEIFFDPKNQPVSKARYHYHECVTHLFVDSFAKQIGQWCSRNRLLFTGHVLAEDTLASQTAVVGDAMRFYQYMQAPGMDLLTERERIFTAAKQVSSVAHQLGRRWRLTETYGCTGWDFPFSGHKALGDWQLALGINLRCQHLAWYTMLGQAKRDYPAAISYQSPWWHLYPKVEDYFSRLISVLSRGQEVRNLLLIHPIESMWLKFKANWEKSEEVKKYDQYFCDLTNLLLAYHLDFDYGNEELLAKYGRIGKQNGQLTLTVGKANYTTVLVPEMLTMRSSTFQLLRRFREAGGQVVFTGKVASFLDACPTEEVKRLADNCPVFPESGSELIKELEKTCRRVSITDNSGKELTSVLYLLCEDKEAFYLFVCNTGENFLSSPEERYNQVMVRERTIACPEVIIRGFPAWGQPAIELDPETGQPFSAQVKNDDNGWQIHTDLPAIGSRLFIIPRKEKIAAEVRPTLQEVSRQKLIKERWNISLSEPNVLVLDKPEYCLGENQWHPAEEILRLDKQIREKLGIPVRGGAMIQPWARKRNPRPKRLPIALRYPFQVDNLPLGPLSLAIEKPELYRIQLNGQEINPVTVSGWWVDLSLKTLPVDPAYLRLGKNELILSFEYDENHPGLEIIYLLGNFGVRLQEINPVIIKLPDSLPLGDWTQQGLLFYSGSVTYLTTLEPVLQPGERIFLHLPDYRGVAGHILVNGQSAGVISWPPNELDLTDWLTGKKEVTLGIEVIGHRRNSHGPFHLKEKWPAWTGPNEFQPPSDQWFEGYQLVPCGLFSPPELIVRQPKD
ncbi:MAG: hypothetical protein NC911_05105 [Candidatus Omnitrophica bacterium]|nr:hypothetical protein [Candidatus Omnitrophota bacterium]